MKQMTKLVVPAFAKRSKECEDGSQADDLRENHHATFSKSKYYGLQKRGCSSGGCGKLKLCQVTTRLYATRVYKDQLTML